MKLLGRGRCNRCTFEDVALLAKQANAHVEVRVRGDELPARLGEQEQFSGPLGRGYDLFIVYPDGPAWAAWLSGLEPACWCGRAEDKRPEAFALLR